MSGIKSEGEVKLDIPAWCVGKGEVECCTEWLLEADLRNYQICRCCSNHKEEASKK